MLQVRLARLKGGALKPASMLAAGRVLGEVEEYFIEQLTPGDTFVFAGEVLRFEGLRENDAIVTRAHATEPKVPSYDGGKFPLSTYLADRVRDLLADPQDLVAAARPGLGLAAAASRALGRAGADEMLVETFPRGQQALSRLLPVRGPARAPDARHAADAPARARARRAARLRRQRICARRLGAQRHGRDGARRGRLDLAQLFDEDMLGDDLDAWLAESSLMKRSFRVCAIISGLIERRHPGQEKTGRQMTVSSDLIYDVLRQHEPGPHPAQGGLRRCGNRSDRCRPPRTFLADESRGESGILPCGRCRRSPCR